MSVVSQMSLEDVGALFLGPSSLMADPFGPLLDEDEESALSEGSSSPLSSSYAESSSSFSLLSPSRPASVGCKSELLSLSWPSASDLLTVQTEPEQSEGEALHTEPLALETQCITLVQKHHNNGLGQCCGSIEWVHGY